MGAYDESGDERDDGEDEGEEEEAVAGRGERRMASCSGLTWWLTTRICLRASKPFSRRRRGSLSTREAMNSLTGWGIRGSTLSKVGTSSCTCLKTTVTGLAELKGVWPVSISQPTIPKE